MARDWTTFTRRITVNYPAQAIYDAWAIPSQIERWFLRSARYVGLDSEPRRHDAHVMAGDAYLWRWHGYGDDVSEGGLVTEANGHDKFAFTFTRDCLVTVTVVEEAGETVVNLTQSRIPDDDDDHNIYVDCSYGWAFYLANLKSILEGGLDLRNKNANIKNLVNS